MRSGKSKSNWTWLLASPPLSLNLRGKFVPQVCDKSARSDGVCTRSWINPHELFGFPLHFAAAVGDLCDSNARSSTSIDDAVWKFDIGYIGIPRHPRDVWKILSLQSSWVRVPIWQNLIVTSNTEHIVFWQCSGIKSIHYVVSYVIMFFVRRRTVSCVERSLSEILWCKLRKKYGTSLLSFSESAGNIFQGFSMTGCLL